MAKVQTDALIQKRKKRLVLLCGVFCSMSCSSL